jgi:hypothetical protein
MIRIACHDVDNPMVFWREYARQHWKTLRDYDRADAGQPNVLTAREALLTQVIKSRLTLREAEELERSAVGAPWGGVSVAAALTDADPEVPDGLFAAGAALYWHFLWPERPRGIRVAKVHKVLHLKRRAFYPILDSHLRGLYKPCAVKWIEPLAHLGRLSLDDSPPFWAAIRHDLVKNQAELASYKPVLAADEDEHVRWLAELTDLRRQDILSWSIAP